MGCQYERADYVPVDERKSQKGDTDSVETTKLQKKITRKESESSRHSDSIQQGQSYRKHNSGSHEEEDEDDDTDNNDEE